MENKLELTIAHIYPELLNINGNSGNILTLKKRLEWRNIKLNILNVNLHETSMPENCDIYYIGAGQGKNFEIAAAGINQNKDILQKLKENNSVILGIDGGYQLLGKYYKTIDGRIIQCAEILNCYTIEGEKRLTGNVTAETKFLSDKILVGFENHSGLTYLENGTKPLGKVIIGHGNNLTSKEEGAKENNVFGTYLHGPVLPQNPAFCDYLIELAIKNKIHDDKFKLSELDDNLEILTHKSIVNKAY